MPAERDDATKIAEVLMSPSEASPEVRVVEAAKVIRAIVQDVRKQLNREWLDACNLTGQEAQDPEGFVAFVKQKATEAAWDPIEDIINEFDDADDAIRIVAEWIGESRHAARVRARTTPSTRDGDRGD